MGARFMRAEESLRAKESPLGAGKGASITHRGS